MNEAETSAVTATIDSTEVSVAQGSTILQAARSAGIYIPTLCHLECLPDYGGCRLCMVEVKGMRGTPAACTTPVTSGMEVATATPELQQLRRQILELILSEHPYTCLVCADKSVCPQFMHSTRKVSSVTGCNFCPRNGNCQLQQLVEYLELTEIRFPVAYRGFVPRDDNPFYTIDYNLCILCGRCVRMCNEKRYSEVLAFVGRGTTAMVGTAFGESQKEAGCEYCGACVDVCPTSALSEKLGRWAGRPDGYTETFCVLCSSACGMTVNKRGNRIVNIGPHPGGRDDPPQLCVRGKFVVADICHHPERVTAPHIKIHGQWAETGWEEALEYIGRKLAKQKGERFGLIGSGHDTLENSYILQRFVRRVMKSCNVDLSPPFSSSTVIGDIHKYLLTEGFTSVDDILQADEIYVVGAQAHWSHPMVENRVRKAFRAGREVVVAHSAHVRTALFSTAFHRYARGREHIFLYGLLEDIASQNDRKKRVIVVGDEVLQSSCARESVNGLRSLAASSEGRTRLIFLLPEGNRYGAVLAGMNPALLPGFVTADSPGLAAQEMMEVPRAVSSLLVVGDIAEARALADLSFFVQLNLFFTPASQHAQVFLPMTMALESDGHIINQEGRLVELSPAAGKARDVRSTGWVMDELAKAIDGSPLLNGQTDLGQRIRRLVDETMAGTCSGARGKSTAPDTESYSENSCLTAEGLRQSHFHYMGNSLVDKVADLQKILD